MENIFFLVIFVDLQDELQLIHIIHGSCICQCCEFACLLKFVTLKSTATALSQSFPDERSDEEFSLPTLMCAAEVGQGHALPSSFSSCWDQMALFGFMQYHFFALLYLLWPPSVVLKSWLEFLRVRRL